MVDVSRLLTTYSTASRNSSSASASPSPPLSFSSSPVTWLTSVWARGINRDLACREFGRWEKREPGRVEALESGRFPRLDDGRSVFLEDGRASRLDGGLLGWLLTDKLEVLEGIMTIGMWYKVWFAKKEVSAKMVVCNEAHDVTDARQSDLVFARFSVFKR